jgi:hypothetical protein
MELYEYELKELEDLLIKFADDKSWTYHDLFEALRTLEFEMRLEKYKEHLE